MRELEGRSYNEIAELLGLTTAALETLLFRARRSLAEELENLVTCQSAQLALSKQLDGRLGRKERRRLDDHLAECQDCARLAEMQKRQRRAFKGLAIIPIPVGLALFKGAPSASAASSLPTIGLAATGAGANGTGGAAGAAGAGAAGAPPRARAARPSAARSWRPRSRWQRSSSRRPSRPVSRTRACRRSTTDPARPSQPARRRNTRRSAGEARLARHERRGGRRPRPPEGRGQTPAVRSRHSSAETSADHGQSAVLRRARERARPLARRAPATRPRRETRASSGSAAGAAVVRLGRPGILAPGGRRQRPPASAPPSSNPPSSSPSPSPPAW